MAKQIIQIELEDDTVRELAVLGSPLAVLARLASATADGVRHRQSPRAHTNASLRVERDKADDRDVDRSAIVEAAADEVLRVARDHADELVQPTRIIEDARDDADATLEAERSERRRKLAQLLTVERGATDTGLSGERAGTDAMIVDLREANQHMVATTVRAHELQLEADAARERAEKSEQELRAVAEFREMFIGILGHDLRSPLGALMMNSETMVRRRQLDEHDAQAVARILRSGERMTRMIAQLLDLTRARLGGGFPLEPAPTDLGAICQHVVEEFEPTSMQLKVDGDLTGTWDRDRLAEVLSNLAGNAAEHRERGTSVSVRAHAEAAEVLVEVSNQGPPIPADLLPHLFEPFRRARQREKSPNGNLGLGLYIAHQIVLAHGGTLEAHSEGGTTTFVMRLPRPGPTG